jgi:hypothetical protein
MCALLRRHRKTGLQVQNTPTASQGLKLVKPELRVEDNAAKKAVVGGMTFALLHIPLTVNNFTRWQPQSNLTSFRVFGRDKEVSCTGKLLDLLILKISSTNFIVNSSREISSSFLSLILFLFLSISSSLKGLLPLVLVSISSPLQPLLFLHVGSVEMSCLN